MKPTKFEQMLRWEHFASIINAVAAAALSIAFWDAIITTRWVSFLVGLVTSIVVAHVLNVVVGLALIHYFYRGDQEELATDLLAHERGRTMSTSATVEPAPFLIEIVDAPPEHIGSYQGENIYDWLEVKSEGRQFRVRFHSTIDLQKTGWSSLAANQILFPPGIVYQVEPA